MGKESVTKITVDKKDVPRCQSKINGTYGGDDRCRFPGKYNFFGIQLCHRHASSASLEYLILKKGVAK